MLSGLMKGGFLFLAFFLALSLASSIIFQPGHVYLSGNNTTGLVSSSGGYASNNNYELWIAPPYFWPYPPVAKMQLSPSSGSPPLNVNFNASQSYDPDGGPLRYNWIYQAGNGNQTSSQVSFQHTFQNSGLYSVWLTVTDDENMSDSTYGTIAVCESGNCPDPSVTGTDIHFNRHSKVYFDGENVSVNVNIHNLGAELDKNLVVDVKDLDANMKKRFVIEPGEIGSCQNGGGYTLTWNFTAKYVGHSNHTLEVVLDPGNSISECDESNNIAEMQFYVYPGSRCGLDVQPSEIAATKDCKDYYGEVCNSDLGIKPDCCNSQTCCSNNKSSVGAYIANPEFTVYANGLTSTGGTLTSRRTVNEEHRIEYKGSFTADHIGTYTITWSGSASDGSTCRLSKQVTATFTGHESDWSDVEVENIEVTPAPLTGLKSKIYAVLKNNGKVEADNVEVYYSIVTGRCTKTGYVRSIMAYTNGQGPTPTLTINAMKPGEEKKIYLGEFEPTEKGEYCIDVQAIPQDAHDYNLLNNEMRRQITVGFGRKITKTAVPEYPGVTAIVGLLIVLGLAYLISRRV